MLSQARPGRGPSTEAAFLRYKIHRLFGDLEPPLGGRMRWCRSQRRGVVPVASAKRRAARLLEDDGRSHVPGLLVLKYGA